MATHSSILAWRIPWLRSRVGYSPSVCQELDTTEATEHTSIQYLLIVEDLENTRKHKSFFQIHMILIPRNKQYYSFQTFICQFQHFPQRVLGYICMSVQLWSTWLLPAVFLSSVPLPPPLSSNHSDSHPWWTICIVCGSFFILWHISCYV